MKKGLIVLLAITLIFSIFATVGNQESIVICASSEQFRNDALQEQLNERFPDKNIIVMYMSTGKAAAKVYAEGVGTEIDILVGLETGYMNKITDQLADISEVRWNAEVSAVLPAVAVTFYRRRKSQFSGLFCRLSTIPSRIFP